MVLNLLERDIMQITKNFSYQELACPCCGEMLMEHDFVNALQKIRDSVGRPMFINSAYRCEAHNLEVGGAITSRHLKGCAVDISIDGWAPDDLHYLLFEITSLQHEFYSTGLGVYEKHIHFDFRPDIESAWINL